MNFLIEHTYLWFCWWDLPFFIAFLAVTIVCVVKLRNKRKERDELQDRLDEYEEERGTEERTYQGV